MGGWLLALAAVALRMGGGWAGTAGKSADSSASGSPTFYGDVLPVLQEHCQVCHRAGGIAPMAFETYAQVQPYAEAIRVATEKRTMPPWFAYPKVGKFSN